LMYSSIILFIALFFLCMSAFVMLLRKKVQVPLKKLKRAIQLLSEDNSYEPINYRGPKEFVEICDNFNVMLNKLQTSELDRNKLIKDKQSMLADISHDLKTPITTIQGYSKALAEGVISTEEYEKYFNIIYSRSQRLTELINIFYEYSKLEHPDFKLVFEEVDLSEYLRAYVASRYEHILESEFDIEVDIPEHILKYKIDKVQFQRALDNLLGNSIKHNPKETKIYIGLKEEESFYKIIIADTGVGIPKEISENIFSPFTVGDESRNSRQGSGLGLAITKTIVEMHGGRIKLCNCEKSEYSTVFKINLPYVVNS
ncbi:HAMP domain-containing sensor histidine kinase, partial [Clostridium sp.]|uniref:HAMP domain-containing sensor histidine kinase n=1 Tax=Clostridium sp. TaxID=1506 RepID=UPI003F36EBFB